MEGLPTAEELYNISVERQKANHSEFIKQFKELFIAESKKAAELGKFHCVIKLDKTLITYELMCQMAKEVEKYGFETSFCVFEAHIKIYWEKFNRPKLIPLK